MHRSCIIIIVLDQSYENDSLLLWQIPKLFVGRPRGHIQSAYRHEGAIYMIYGLDVMRKNSEYIATSFKRSPQKRTAQRCP